MKLAAHFLLTGSLVVGMVVLGVVLFKHGYGYGDEAKPGLLASGGSRIATPNSAKTERKPMYWYDPMEPEHHFDKPGRSPFMDMQLAPKYSNGFAGSGTIPSGSIVIEPRVVQNLGVRLGVVERGRFARNIDTVGAVAVDEHRIEAIQVRQPGWVEQLYVRAVGDTVRRGQRLAGVYAPELLATQQELLIARDSQDPKLIAAARRRLELFGLSRAQIAQVEKAGRPKRRVDYYAPFDGYVMELAVRQGGAVEPGGMLLQLASLDSVWINAEVPETQAAWIKTDDPATVEVPAFPGEHFAGHVDYLYPELMPTTRTLKVRLVVKNSDKRLRPGMFAAVHLLGATRSDVLTVPTEAVIRTGTRSVVIVADNGTHFRPRLVRVGQEHDGRSEILEGLSPGQNVVASGQFLIDSEATLRGAFSHLAGASETPDPAPSSELMPSPVTPGLEGGH